MILISFLLLFAGLILVVWGINELAEGNGFGVIIVMLELILFLVMVFSLSDIPYPVKLSNETAQDICRNLNANHTQGTIYNAYSEDGKLICETPSFDHTLNIVFKETGE